MEALIRNNEDCLKSEKKLENQTEIELMNELNKAFVEKFGTPEFVLDYIDVFLNPKEKLFIEKLDRKVFDATYIASILGSEDAAEMLISSGYRRGILDKIPVESDVKQDDNQDDTMYTLGSFYRRLDIIAVSETERYNTLPVDIRTELDKWCFQIYMDSLGDNYEEVPTADKVYTLSEMMEIIDNHDGDINLNNCDCKCLTDNQKYPRKVCLSFSSGPNSYADRGFLQKLNSEDAKNIVREADKAGLMHTFNGHAICNCNRDSCYLFRAMEARNSLGIWPITERRIVLDSDKCVGCGKCISRCQYEVFSRKDGSKDIIMDKSPCVGCGLCVTTCPVGALSLGTRQNNK